MSLRLFVKVDVDFASDPKILEAGPAAEALFVRGLAVSERTLSDGHIARAQLAILTHGFSAKDAQRAVAALEATELWTVTPTGWVITAWAKHHRPAAEIRRASERKRLAGVKANHDRWHTKSKGSHDCPYCTSESDPLGIPTGSCPDSPDADADVDVDAPADAPASAAAAQAIELLVAQRLKARHEPPGHPERWAITVRTELLAKHGPALDHLHAEHPDLEPYELAAKATGVSKYELLRLAETLALGATA